MGRIGAWEIPTVRGGVEQLLEEGVSGGSQLFEGALSVRSEDPFKTRWESSHVRGRSV